MTAGGGRGRAANLLNISPWRLRMRLVAFSLAELNPLELVAIPRSRFPKPNLSQILAPDWKNTEINLDEIMHTVERYFIKMALDSCNDNKTEAATILSLSRRSFQHRVERSNYEQVMAQTNASQNEPAHSETTQNETSQNEIIQNEITPEKTEPV
jgi:hypothetical protein